MKQQQILVLFMLYRGIQKGRDRSEANIQR